MSYLPSDQRFMLLELETTYADGSTTVDENDLIYAENPEVNREDTVHQRKPATGEGPNIRGVTGMHSTAFKFTTELVPETLSASSSVFPSIHKILQMCGWTATHDAVSPFGWDYTIAPGLSNSSAYIEMYEWNEDRSQTLEHQLDGCRATGKILCPRGDRIMFEVEGKASAHTLLRTASASVPDLSAGSGLSSDIVLVGSAATVSVQDGSSNNLTGSLLDLEVDPQLTLSEHRSGEGTGALDRVALVRNEHGLITASFELDDADFNTYNWWNSWRNNETMTLSFTWSDAEAAGNVVILTASAYIESFTHNRNDENRNIVETVMRPVHAIGSSPITLRFQTT